MINFILNASFAILVIFAITYLWYCVSLALLLAKLNAAWWKAFIPIYNISALVNAIGLPKKWFFLSIAPYLGSVYAVAIAYRLGLIWKMHFAFSAFWLTLGAPIGFLILVFSKRQPNMEVIKNPPPSLAFIKTKLKHASMKSEKI